MVYDAEYDSPAPIHIMNGIVSVSAGEYQTSAIKDNGELWTWGSMLGVGAVNHETRRGYGDDPYKMMDGVKAVSAGHGHHAAVKTNGEVWTWGANNAGQLGCGDTENRYFFPNYAVKAMDGVMTVSAGAAHTLALTANGGLWAWGSNAYGQIGDGTYENRLTPVKVMDNVAAIATGKNHSLAVTKDGVLLAWGDNHIRQLGADSGDNSPVPVWVMDGMMIPEPEITVLLDGKQLFFDQTPVIEDGRTLVPLRKIFEALGAVVDWQDETQTVTAEKDGKKVSLTIGDKSASVDGKTVTLDVPAKIANGRTLVPARFVAESLGCAVDWDNDLQTVLITG
jgi:hypothetical protein